MQIKELSTKPYALFFFNKFRASPYDRPEQSIINELEWAIRETLLNYREENERASPKMFYYHIKKKKHLLFKKLKAHTRNRLIFFSEVQKMLKNDLGDLTLLDDIPQRPYNIKIDASSGDRHDNSKSTSRVILGNGQEFFYKPRGVYLDTAFSSMLKLIENEAKNFSFDTFHAFGNNHYMWSKSVRRSEFTTEIDPRFYFRNAGGITAIATLLGAIDLHCENIIAGKSSPIIIDTESIFSPERADYSILNTGLIQFKKDSSEHDSNASGFFSDETVAITRETKTWNTNKEKPQYLVKTKFLKNCQNHLMLNGAVVRIEDYKPSFIKGFNDMLMWFQSMKNSTIFLSMIDLFTNTSGRKFFRKTSDYASIIEESLTPYSLKSREQNIKSILHGLALRDLFFLNKASDIESVINCELNSILKLDIPLFSFKASDRNLYYEGSSTIEDYFAVTPLENLKLRIKNFSGSDRQKLNEQMRICLGS